MDQPLQELQERLRCLSEKTVSAASGAAGYVEQRTEEASISRHLEQEIDDLEDQADLQLYRIGLMVYGTHTGTHTPSDELLSALEEIDRLKSRVARARGQLVRLRGGRACGRCGAAAREDDRFCRSCGARL